MVHGWTKFMTGFDEHDNPTKPKERWRDDTPSSRPLKLALIAAAVICIIAIIVYFKARHQPPALHDMLQTQPAARPLPGSMRAQNRSFRMPASKAQEAASWTLYRTVHSTQS